MPRVPMIYRSQTLKNGDSVTIYRIQRQLVSTFPSQFQCHLVQQPLLLLADDSSDRLTPH